MEFVKLTVIDAKGAAEIGPEEVNVKGTLNVNKLPNALEAVVPYQVENAEFN